MNKNKFYYKEHNGILSEHQNSSLTLHSFYDEPSVLTYDDENNMSLCAWHKDGFLHREQGPALIMYQNGKIIEKKWYKNDELHRENGPASIGYKDEIKNFEGWYFKNKAHRDDGPAEIWYIRDTEKHYWYIENIYIDSYSIVNKKELKKIV